ncbi:zf-HC2 domain-containing protein [Marivirga harenae]|uniref:zf-HC2 domain-containing protein n=1 Tax=Marivirga harenae TaxID=2010992 RepID=UPI0026E080D5|nr:zf-HC2 domain-containing protein [Marivirga harenae]WKV13800.1 zf-HC2 domain-containing protein [Marivirga harenae]|tara:strand:+ start:101105 stop:101365 length:261 start_codon:yes stop_codon:yes gene_type:complete
MNKQTMEVEQNQACTELLQLVIDGQATAEQHQELMKHLERCEECREEYLLSKSITDSLKNHIKPNYSPNGLANTIQSKISETASLK